MMSLHSNLAFIYLQCNNSIHITKSLLMQDWEFKLGLCSRSSPLPSNSQPLPTSQSPPKYVHSSTVLTLICQEGNSSCIQLLMLSDISTSAAHRGKIAEKVHKPPLGVNIINFELNGFNASIWVPWSPSDQKYIMH